MRKQWITPSHEPNWFVVHPGERPQPQLSTASYKRNRAIEYWLDAAGETWAYWYRRGYRVRQVKIKWQVQ